MAQKLFVAWDTPEERCLAYDPKNFAHSEPAGITEVVELTQSDLRLSATEEELSEEDFLDCVRDGDIFELRDGTFVAHWRQWPNNDDSISLSFVNSQTNEEHLIWLA